MTDLGKPFGSWFGATLGGRSTRHRYPMTPESCLGIFRCAFFRVLPNTASEKKSFASRENRHKWSTSLTATATSCRGCVWSWDTGNFCLGLRSDLTRWWSEEDPLRGSNAGALGGAGGFLEPPPTPLLPRNTPPDNERRGRGVRAGVQPSGAGAVDFQKDAADDEDEDGDAERNTLLLCRLRVSSPLPGALLSANEIDLGIPSRVNDRPRHPCSPFLRALSGWAICCQCRLVLGAFSLGGGGSCDPAPTS